MELPSELKQLYRHWGFHVRDADASTSFAAYPILEEIGAFVLERMAIWKKKTLGAPQPYTQDPVLARYRFCNIFREFDRQTIAYHKLLAPLRDDFPLWLLNMFYCRVVARPETVAAVGLLSFDKKENETFFRKLSSSPRPRYGTPYVFPVSVILKSATPTRELFLAKHLPAVMRDVAKEIRTWRSLSVVDGVKKILPIFGYNFSFLWTETLIDVAYQYPERIDLFKSFPVGPGALPTFRAIAPSQDPSHLARKLTAYDIPIDLTYEDRPLRLSAENWEGIGCEFRKYTNLRQEKGRRRIYTPHQSQTKKRLVGA